jgi:hypothetical protein
VWLLEVLENDRLQCRGGPADLERDVKGAQKRSVHVETRHHFLAQVKKTVPQGGRCELQRAGTGVKTQAQILQTPIAESHQLPQEKIFLFEGRLRCGKRRLQHKRRVELKLVNRRRSAGG